MQTNSQILPVRSTCHEAPWALHLERKRHDKSIISGCLNPFPFMEGKVFFGQGRESIYFSPVEKKSVLRSSEESSAKFRLCPLCLQWYRGLVNPIPGEGIWDGLCYLLTLRSLRGISHTLSMKTKLAPFFCLFVYLVFYGVFGFVGFWLGLVWFFHMKIPHVHVFLRNET